MGTYRLQRKLFSSIYKEKQFDAPNQYTFGYKSNITTVPNQPAYAFNQQNLPDLTKTATENAADRVAKQNAANAAKNFGQKNILARGTGINNVSQAWTGYNSAGAKLTTGQRFGQAGKFVGKQALIGTAILGAGTALGIGGMKKGAEQMDDNNKII